MQVDMVVCKADYRHLDSITAIWKQFMDYHKGIDPLFTRSKRGSKNFRKFIGELAVNENALVLAALEDEKVIGYSVTVIENYPPVFKLKQFAHLFDMAVVEKYRRSGAGAMMMAEIVKWCKSKGMSRIELQVVSANVIGNNFWQKSGFREYMKKMFVNI